MHKPHPEQAGFKRKRKGACSKGKGLSACILCACACNSIGTIQMYSYWIGKMTIQGIVRASMYHLPHPKSKKFGQAFPPIFNLFSPLGAKGKFQYYISKSNVHDSRTYM